MVHSQPRQKGSPSLESRSSTWEIPYKVDREDPNTDSDSTPPLGFVKPSVKPSVQMQGATEGALPQAQPVDLVALLTFMQTQEDTRRREEETRRMEEKEKEEARRMEEKEKEAARHREWMTLEMKKLELEEKWLQQNATAEQAQRVADSQREEERRKEGDLDRRPREIAQFRIPRMKEEEDVELYLESFEARLQSLEIPEYDSWVDNLRPLLSTWAARII